MELTYREAPASPHWQQCCLALPRGEHPTTIDEGWQVNVHGIGNAFKVVDLGCVKPDAQPRATQSVAYLLRIVTIRPSVAEEHVV
jgi:hypothetical protein